MQIYINFANFAIATRKIVHKNDKIKCKYQ